MAGKSIVIDRVFEIIGPTTHDDAAFKCERPSVYITSPMNSKCVLFKPLITVLQVELLSSMTPGTRRGRSRQGHADFDFNSQPP